MNPPTQWMKKNPIPSSLYTIPKSKTKNLKNKINNINTLIYITYVRDRYSTCIKMSSLQ
jgi:hypothetical protein